MELTYKGSTTDEENVTGQISIPEIAYDTEEDEYTFSITINNDKSSKEPVKALIRKQIVPKLRSLLGRFGPDLIETHGKDIQHPDSSLSASSSQATSGSATPKEPKSVVGTSAYNTTSLHFEPVFNADSNQIYNALTNPEMVAAWTRSKPDIAPVEGSDYSLFGGNITGKILKLRENESIEQTWRLRDWKDGHFAKMNLNFKTQAGETTVKVDWSGIPVGQEEVVEKNFEEYYVKSIKLTFGFGAVL
ncbi:Aha1p [Sugiyamaella lignohabitans]|uniref:Aha1p n=1 Tax=Sugiyamaella lignohabitans TaxID=796027 RepID=A0A167DZ14_9ASCO|nr:Aha1p [Sugiyamaella lignohabitans]ANB13461.1 Aha1p [Sugiyamaella lignohabitans]